MHDLLTSLSYDKLHSQCQSGSGSRLEKLYIHSMYSVLQHTDSGEQDGMTFERKKLKGKYARTSSVIEISDGTERLIVGRVREKGGATYLLASTADWYACWVLLMFS